MQQSTKDPAIKLFGQQIPLTEPETDKDEMEALQQDGDDDEEDSDSQQHKTLKKPDQILACPRCRSMDTKFCYYNNYNVKQPRHLCKACQRYWTAGGSMRDVPIGAGRRKSVTSSASPYRHITSTMLNFKLDRPIVSNSREEQRGGDIISSFMQNNATFSSNGVPVSFYWNYPWVAPSSLGKHSRQEGDIDEPKQKTCVLVPKALRIDDPKEAAKSSIWKTLGIRAEPLSGGGMFQAFQPKEDEKKEIDHLVETSPALMANPAALSRSLNFHERS